MLNYITIGTKKKGVVPVSFVFIEHKTMFASSFDNHRNKNKIAQNKNE